MSGGGMKNRRSIRLKEYDYTQAGFYFITICTQNRIGLFGKIENGEMALNDAGKMIQTAWNEIPIYYNGFDVDEFVVMPNHIHGIIKIKHNNPTVDMARPVGAGPRACPGPIGQPQGVAPTAIKCHCPILCIDSKH